MKLNLKEICSATASRDKSLIKRAALSKVVGTRSRKNFRRFIFHVKSKSSDSNRKGHLVTILFPNIKISDLKTNKALKPVEQRVRIYCSCPAFQYWGSAYHATKFKYNITGKNESIAPNTRDPKTTKLVCKHIYAVYKDIENDNFIRLYNRFKKSYYRKRDKSKKSSESLDSMLLFIFEHLVSKKGLSKKQAIDKIKELQKSDTIEEYLLLEDLII